MSGGNRWAVLIIGPAQLIDGHVERALLRDVGVFLAHGAGSGVAGVGEEPLGALALGGERLVFLGDSRVHRFKSLFGHKDLATHLEAARRIAFQFVRDGGDAADVGGDVLAAPAVAARGGLGQPPLFVDEGDRQAVDLGLGDVDKRLAVQQVGGAAAPLAQFVGVEGVAETEERQAVLDDGERGLLNLRADLLGGAVGGDQLGIALFELAQLGEERVIIGVADFRVVVDEIAAVVMADLLAQLFHAVARRQLGAVCALARCRGWVVGHRKLSIRARQAASNRPDTLAASCPISRRSRIRSARS